MAEYADHENVVQPAQEKSAGEAAGRAFQQCTRCRIARGYIRRKCEHEAGETAELLADSLHRLLQPVSCLTIHPCVKGRFFDSMQCKLEQLDRTRSNEVTRVDFTQLAGQLWMKEAED